MGEAEYKAVKENESLLQDGRVFQTAGAFDRHLLTLLGPACKYYEVTVVSADIHMVVISKDNVLGGHKEAVRSIVRMIEKGPNQGVALDLLIHR